MRRLSKAGFRAEFIRSALLPDWWEPSCENDVSLLPEIEIRIARFLQLPTEEIRRPNLALRVPTYPGAKLRKVANVDGDRLSASIHAGLQIANAVNRSLRSNVSNPKIPPTNPEVWFKEVLETNSTFNLESSIKNLWSRGIPVVHIELLPNPKFQGLACIVKDRPMVLLGHAHNEPSRLALHVAHEVAHIANSDCRENIPVVDEDYEEPDTAAIEKRADAFALAAVRGNQTLPSPKGPDPLAWAKQAYSLEKTHGIDAGAVIWNWAFRTKEFAKGQMAVAALYRDRKGQQVLRNEFDRHVDFEGASETDQALLKCVFLDPERNATSH